MQKVNYQKKCEEILQQIQPGGEHPPRLLLHSCCAPCSSYVLEYLRPYFAITVYFYNPNLLEEEEYHRRKREQIRLVEAMAASGQGHAIEILEGDDHRQDFVQLARGLEAEAEGGIRCRRCYALRLGNTARLAASQGYDYFGTTLTISPRKDAERLNALGRAMAAKYGSAWLWSDFKKREGYKRSVELSKEWGLYRQDYCGCPYSKSRGR